MSEQRSFIISGDDGVEIAAEEAGSGPAIVLLHGLTATRRYVVMGSRALERSGHRVLAYDARGHGRSAPAPDPAAYGYEHLAADLRSLLDACEVGRAVIVGASMGAHTALRFALEHPARVAALALVTPAFDPAHARDPDVLADWDRLAAGLREEGVEGFVRAYDLQGVPAAWRATVERVLRQRLAAHEHPEAVADALEAVPRSLPFESIEALAAIDAPALVVASRDEVDPGHPLAIAERYAQVLGDAELILEEEGRSPIAWQGGQLSAAVAALASRVRA